jgi:hypothetical protein
MRALVCGGRNFRDYDWLCEVLSGFENSKGAKITEVIHGAARGADRLAGEWAKSQGLSVREFPANWELHGHSAGSRRNAQMLAEGQPDVVIAFPGGAGTADMVLKAKIARVPVVQLKEHS